MTDFLLELRSEEIPARMQDNARAALEVLFINAMEAVGIDPRIETYATPRRLALIAKGLPLETAAVSEEIKGPKVAAPPQALEGFLRKTGLARDQLVERDGVLFAVIDKPGRATADVLAEAIPRIIRAFPWPKSMRWGPASLSTESLRWVRPLQSIIALMDGLPVNFEVSGVVSGRETVGHRFHSSGIVSIDSAATYVDQLRAAHVIVDQDERANIIAVGAKMAARKAGLTLIEDAGLLAENAGLTEWPVPLLGRFDEAFLRVPPEVIQLTARVNQKYFVCADADGKLANAFICTANIDAADGGAKIVDGNRKVLAARLSDATFFYETDLKVPLDEQAKKLDRIVFHEKLGTVADKVARVAKLARWLVEEGIVTSPLPLAGGAGGGPLAPDAALAARPTPNPSRKREGDEELATLAERAALLCKADLVTGMVGEFPELQGLMGGYYATAQGEDPRVAAAIRDHYKPVGQGDDVPTDPVTVAVSLADKLDTVFAFFLVDILPSGSRDPFAIRRAALATLATITLLNISLSMSLVFNVWWVAAFRVLRSRTVADTVSLKAAISNIELLKKSAMEAFKDEDAAAILQKDVLIQRHAAVQAMMPAIIDLNDGESMVPAKILNFFADRLKVQQREAGVRHDLIDAVFALGGEDDLVRLLARVHALQAFIGTADGANLLAGYKRAANILKKEGATPAQSVTPAKAGATIGVEPAEAALIAALDVAAPAATAAVAAEDFAAAMAALASLRAPIDAFFEGVIVNDADPAKRAARLALLARVRDAVHGVADFSKIEG